MDPEHATGFKFLQMFLTALVVVPTLLTVFTITASMEVAGRMRGGKGLLGWIRTLPWDRPMVLATGLAFLMLFFGGGGGLINMSYGMNAMVHNTSWVTAHFHLIFGGTVVIMYFAIAYYIWPTLTGREFASRRALTTQLWLWCIGMMVMTLPWHYLGLRGQWRRVAEFDYSNPIIAAWGPWVIVSFIGGAILLVSAVLFIVNLSSPYRRNAAHVRDLVAYARPAHPAPHIRALNGFGMWNVVVLVLMLAAYGFPIAQFFIFDAPEAIVHRINGGG
jgi:cytochrome c oxidase subunit 1